MNREAVVAKFEAIKASPGFKFASGQAKASTPEEQQQEQSVHDQFDELLQECVEKVPADYQFTDEDRKAVKELFTSGEGRKALDYIGCGNPVLEAIAPIRSGLVEFHLPVHGGKLKNWSKWANRFKPVIIDG